MTKEIVIRAEGLGKKYIIDHEAMAEPYVALRDAMMRALRSSVRSTVAALRGRVSPGGRTKEEFWALKDVSFEIERGTVMGFIGRNGAGKSTLLKILSRITDPTEGRVTIDGRLASLLDVGTGFHPELTGRENIYLNGAMLGMTRSEIRAKFDEIVEFGEVERFLDTPVKKYSSGMYLRLAFSIGAHLESEILVVDEVLAVGDANFQEKCIGKMSEVAGGGRTVLFVSHDMTAVKRLCDKAVLLNAGCVEYIGGVRETIERYVTAGQSAAHGSFDISRCERAGSGNVRVEDISFSNFRSFQVFEDMEISIRLSADDPDDMESASVWLLFRNIAGDDVLMVMQKDAAATLPRATAAEVLLRVNTVLQPGRYFVAFGVLGHGRDVLDWVDAGPSIQVEGSFSGAGPYDSRLGLVTMKADWQVRSLEAEGLAAPRDAG
jgi:ABC-type polysaccharide/polyol phosphate transport system ATPase subunit